VLECLWASMADKLGGGSSVRSHRSETTFLILQWFPLSKSHQPFVKMVSQQYQLDRINARS